MYRILFCLRDQHDWHLVALAFLVCAISNAVVILLINRAKATAGQTRLRWIMTAGAGGGFGIWATHFIGMLAFDPGFGVGYDLKLTALSLVCAMFTTFAGIEIATSRSFKGDWLAGGAILGAGICAMHYLGMLALDVPGRIVWAPGLVAASLMLGIGLGMAAMGALSQLPKRTGSFLAGSLLVLAILSHHFTGMGALTIIPDPRAVVGGAILSSASMSLAIALAAAAVLTLCVIAVRWGRKVDLIQASHNRLFASLLEGVNDYAIVMLDPLGRVMNWNAGAERITGFTAEEAMGKPFADVSTLDGAAAQTYADCLDTALREGRFEVEFSGHRKDGASYCGHCIVTPVRDADDRLLGFAHITQDVTARKADESRILEVSRNLDAALSHMSHGLCVYDRHERLVLANNRFREMYDYDPSELCVGATFRELAIHAMTRRDGKPPTKAQIDRIHHRHRDMVAKGGGDMVSTDFYGKSVAITARTMPDGGWVSTFEDISERHRHEARIAYMASHDELTGLPNRMKFADQLDEVLGIAARLADRVCVIAIDLNGFQGVNDEHGHVIGDDVLRILSARMTATLREGETVARCGGDEFTAARRYNDERERDDFIARLQACLSQPVTIKGADITIDASLGVAIYPQDGLLRDVLLNNADLALSRVKTLVGDHVGYYEADMGEAARERRALAQDLLRALKDNEFRVFYQMQVAVESREITGYEALIRWQHPVRGLVPPIDFIAVAEECGAIIDIGAWVLRAACEEAVRWGNDAKIAVNLSPVQLNDVHLIDTVRQVLIDTGLKPHRLELEITESVLIDDKVRALHILRQIKALGVTIAMDDFGTGYASLDTLNAFPFDKIKIDRSFLMEAGTSPQARAIIRSILALGKSLNIPVLAEGVETEQQWLLLREEGCDEAQGYLLGRPAQDVGPAAAQLTA